MLMYFYRVKPLKIDSCIYLLVAVCRNFSWSSLDTNWIRFFGLVIRSDLYMLLIIIVVVYIIFPIDLFVILVCVQDLCLEGAC